MSCSGSLVEMLLKLAGAAPANYYVEQDRDKNQNVGLTYIKDKQICGKTFRRFDAQSEGITLREQIEKELNAGRCLGVFYSHCKAHFTDG